MQQGDNLSAEVYKLIIAFVHANNRLIISMAIKVEAK